MTVEEDGGLAPTPKKFKTESEEELTEPLKDGDRSEEEKKEIDDGEDEEDGPPPGWHHSLPSSPPLLDMIDFPPSSTLPPTPPLPSSPRDLDMEQQDSDEDDGPPPGWDNKYQLKEQQTEQLAMLAGTSTNSSDIQTEDRDAHNGEGEPRSQAHPSLPREVAPSGEEQDMEDDGPPPGWDSKCQPEPKLQKTPRSDMNMEDVLQDVQNLEGQPTPEVTSDLIVNREDSGDGPPPGWDSKCQPESKVQKTSQSDSSDIKTGYVQQDARNENSPHSQSESRSSPAPELVPSDIKADEQDSEDDGPPPGWNLKCQLETNLQRTCPTTPPSGFKIDENKEDALDNVGSPPGWESTPQQQSHVHSSLPSPIVQSGAGTGYEPNNGIIIEQSPQQPSRQQSIHPTEPQISVPKLQARVNNPEMGQMVCGSCRHLLSYLRGSRYVECACCLEENYVLEEHEVGQVVCGGCNVLLMYPHGAPKVKCANCRVETEIGEQNRLPSLTEHKRRARQHLKRVQVG